MQNAKKRTLTFLLLLGLVGCFNQTPDTEVDAEKTDRAVRPIIEILESKSPETFYLQAYGSFRFSSQSVLSVTKDDQTQTFQGSSALEMDESGNFHLIRIPLSGEPLVELFEINQKIYLKTGDKGEFRALRTHPEFTRWVTVSLQEVFSLFAKANLATNDPNTNRGNLPCWAEEKNALCIDPASTLPVEGNLSLQHASDSVLSVRFNFAQVEPGTLELAPPI